MRSLLLLLSLLGSVLAKASPNTKIDRLRQLSAADKGVVTLNSELFDEFTAKPRNYSITVLLTAMGSQFQCSPCKEFDPEYRLIAKTWRKQPEADRHYFALLDFADGQDIYSRLKMNTAPSIFHYAPTEGPHSDSASEPRRYDFRAGMTGEPFAEFVSRQINAPVPIARPYNYAKILITIVGGLAVLASAKLAWPVARGVVLNKNTWAALSIVTILMMTSGHMWNHIRKPPYVVPNQGGGGVSYIAGGFQNQFGLESQIVAGLYGLCAFCVISLIVTAPKFQEPQRQRLTIMVWTGTLFIIYSLLMSLFRLKNGGYPFKLLF